MVFFALSLPRNALKTTLLVLFCFSQFLDTFNSSAFFSAIPSISSALGLSGNNSVWLISAYQLTFASFLLFSGRISDVYDPKVVFITGIAAFGIFSLASGFIHNKVIFLVFRSIIGIAASLTIPSALHLIVQLHPEPEGQARAIGCFSGSVAVGNVLGLILGGVFVQFASWNWIFFFEAMVALPISIACLLLIPKRCITTTEVPMQGEEPPKATGLDILGVSLLTVSLLLFILALTSGSTSGWGSPVVIAPLVVSITLLLSFIWWETCIPPMTAALPPAIWFYPNFSVLFIVALSPMLWWTVVFFAFSTLWQDVYRWSPTVTAVHLLPIGILGIMVMISSGRLSTRFAPKWIIITGQILVIAATAILPFANSASRYWTYIFPAFCIGTTGTALIFTHSNIAILRSAPNEQSGTVGAIFNASLQLGAAIGVAAITSLQSNVDNRSGNSLGFSGRAAGFWLLLGLSVAEMLTVVAFYRAGNGHEASITSREDAVDKDQEVWRGELPSV